MQSKDNETFQEVVYKPTSLKDLSVSLKPETNQNGNTFLYFTACIANLLTFTSGIAFGWTSPVLPRLNSNNTDVNPLGRPITNTEESWIAGLLCLGGVFGPVLAGYIADRLGRKKSLLIIAFPMLISFLLSAFAQSLLVLYVARFLGGVGVGCTFTIIPMYLGEIAEDHNRGALGCSLGLFVALGILYSFAVGPYLTIRNFCLSSTIPVMIFIFVFSVWIPESPVFLSSNNDSKNVERSLIKLRNKVISELQTEISELSKAVEESRKHDASISDLVKVKGLRKALIIMIGLICLQQCAGINAVFAYMQTIFDSTGGTFPPEISVMVVGLIQVLSIVVAFFLVEKLGRRILLLTSCLGAAASLVALGLYFYWKFNNFDVDSISWWPVLSLISYTIAFNLGLGPLPWAILSELFPSNVKSIAATLTACSCSASAFITTLYFPVIAVSLGMAKSFWMFALVCFGGSIFIYCMLPETKGRSLQEIQSLLEKNSDKPPYASR